MDDHSYDFRDKHDWIHTNYNASITKPGLNSTVSRYW
jgi:hypothetical protein